MKFRVIFLLLAAVTVILITAQCTSAATPASAPTLPANTQAVAATITSAPVVPTDTQVAAAAMDGLALLQDRCTLCHSLQRAVSRAGNAAHWQSVVDNMIQQGTQLTPAEEQILVNYLAQTYP